MSAFGYFGSKLRIAAKMRDRLPPHNAWLEPFCGSAAMTFAKDPAQIEVINDIDGDIVNFYKQLRDHGDKLLDLIQLTPYSRAELDSARTTQKRVSKIERARRFFVSAMMAVNGTFGPAAGGFSLSNSYSRNGMEARVSRWNNMPEYLATVVTRLRSVRIENRDALRLFQDFMNRPAALVYLDPPYLGERTSGYQHDANSETFHKRLVRLASRAKCMLFISGYSHPIYDQMLTNEHGWTRETIPAVTKGNNGKSFQREEVIWFNAAFTTALATKQIPIKFTKKEKKNAKVNPER